MLSSMRSGIIGWLALYNLVTQTVDDNIHSEQKFLKLQTFKMPFVVSLSNHEQPFDRLRENGLYSIFKAMTQSCQSCESRSL